MSDAPFDIGLQPERTLLAWRRTCLALAVGAMLVIKLGAPTLGIVAGIIGVISLGLGAGAYVVATARYRMVHTELSAGRVLPGPGLQVALIALGVALGGSLAAAWVIAVAVDRIP
ncbi:MAG: YidH family protein [Rhodoglobus sp.]|uniref:YidH family protein n=1 Tax=Salinibacterium sp. G-O1 TaxID=3046208 RepID=UPI0024BA6F7D|nr:DUF202 domain-containing protein [Salinibacterium sp. G-O1]MDJ0333943.1 DUF202 domain-containing protein [Salinibacterium sp. G-O1]